MSKHGLIDLTLEGRQRVFFPHFCDNLVPLNPAKNRLWRQRAFSTTNKDDQKTLRRMCREDLLFYTAGFVSIFDAGDDSGTPGAVPFLPYDFQVEAFTVLWDCMNGGNRRSARVKKPRRMGITWMAMVLLEHCWHFFDNRHILVGSRREEEVDGTITISKGGRFSGEWSKLLPKVDFIHLYQPPWLWPHGYTPRMEPYRTRMKIANPERNSIFWGTSATGKAGRQERGWVALWDEAAHTDNLYEIIGGLSQFSPCKLWVSSIGNLDHAFSTTLKDAPGIEQIPLEWHMHPDYAEGMTIDLDTGERSSPWLVRKLDEINHDPVIANSEYFADESKQVGGFYHPDTFFKMLGTSDKPGTVMEPLQVGMLDVNDSESGPFVSRFVDQSNGRWRLWLALGSDGRPPRNTRYLMGCDIAAGTTDQDGRGASNSVLVVVDHLTGEVVAEFVTHGMRPDRLARVACAAGRWFEGSDFAPARIIFERNGPGANFGDVLAKDLRYHNLWRDKDDKFGWFKDGRSDKARLAFGLHQQMICEGRFKERGRECADEMRHYQNPPGGKGSPVHSAALHSSDPSGSRENHGDRTIARVVVCLLLENPYQAVTDSMEAPFGSMRAINQKRSKETFEAQLA